MCSFVCEFLVVLLKAMSFKLHLPFEPVARWERSLECMNNLVHVLYFQMQRELEVKKPWGIFSLSASYHSTYELLLIVQWG